MADHDDIRSGLIDAAASIDAGDTDSARAGVRATARRRQVRNRAGAMAGLVAVVALGAAAVLALAGPDDPDTLVTADPTENTDAVTETTLVPADTASTARTVEVVDVPGVAGAAAGIDGAPEIAEWMTPWRDGFLVGTTTYPPQPLPSELPADVVALFPPEVVDLFAGTLPPTIDEATKMLSDAGLLDEVSAVIQEHPEASAAIYGTPSTDPPVVEARFTTDGITWEPVEMTLPAGAGYLSGVAAVGDRLAVVYSPQELATMFSGSDRFTVAVTTDLINWTTQDVIAPALDVDLPAGIQRSFGPQGLAATERGWAVNVYDSVSVDPLELISAAGLDRPGINVDAGYGVNTDDTGIEVQVGGDPTGSVPPQTTRFTWDELGVTPQVVEMLNGNGSAPQVWASAWDGVAAPSDTRSVSGQLVATAAGYLQWTDRTWFSPDGLTWTPSPLPDPDGYVTSAFVYDGGVIVLSRGADGTADVYRLDETGGSPQLLDVAGLPSTGQSGFSSQSAPGSAVIVDAGEQGPAPQPLAVEVDGYRLTIGTSGTFELSDATTGKVIVSENFMRNAPDENSSFAFGPDGITVTDPDTREVLVVFPSEVLNQADQGTTSDSATDEYTPDLWLFGSRDGQRFLVTDLDDGAGYGGPINLATNGNRVLVNTGDNWFTYDLP